MMKPNTRVIFVIGLLVLLSLSLAALAAQDEIDIEEQNKALVRRVIEEVWNRDREDQSTVSDSINELYKMPFRNSFNIIGNLQRATRGSWLVTVERFYSAFPNLQFTIEQMFAEGDMVIVHYTAHGTFENNYVAGLINGQTELTILASGEEVTWDGILMYRLEDQQIVEEYWYWDLTLFKIFDFSSQ